jgi:type IV pilus assembly protein PilW
MKTSPAQRGFTLVELMIAILIGLFLVGGLLTLVQAMKRTNVSQSGLSQLQENERMAMTLITDVIQSTGYYTTPLTNTAAGAFPVTGSFTAAGQALVGAGTYGSAAPGHSITVRYQTFGGDNIINCTGNTSTVAATFTNTFSIDANGNLQCQLTVKVGATTTVNAAVPLIPGLYNMQIYYGVQSNTAVNTHSIDAYLDAPAVTAGTYWGSVKSVKITLTFLNPLYGTLQGQTTVNTPQYINFTRIIPVMSNTGVST